MRKPDHHFAWRSIAKRWRDSYCRPCRSAYKREHYAKNKARYIENAAKWTQSALVKRKRYLWQFFSEHPCIDCGETDPIVLEFDHLNDKSFDIGRGFRNLNWERVLHEMTKCEVVCVNCHRRRTAHRVGFQRVKSATNAGANKKSSAR
jgi:hypothetical protein